MCLEFRDVDVDASTSLLATSNWKLFICHDFDYFPGIAVSIAIKWKLTVSKQTHLGGV